MEILHELPWICNDLAGLAMFLQYIARSYRNFVVTRKLALSCKILIRNMCEFESTIDHPMIPITMLQDLARFQALSYNKILHKNVQDPARTLMILQDHGRSCKIQCQESCKIRQGSSSSVINKVFKFSGYIPFSKLLLYAILKSSIMT
jgi:hypothetical protein